ncbi:flagellar protein FliT [Enterobacter ludwigii]|jgi:hypothetical protein|uniref:flagellar protein FliT n=1 Tax=Enterobacter TaxID=547 RepID=UPI000668AA9B|nr:MULTISPECIES: flagellar protein FliT [Enterobacter]EKK5416452.1 flagellar protein FliT [Enterobacter hormaechei]EKT9985934.1 flagellar protein FliT [Enterobacter ludwigii]KZP57732.1 hypothetical protein A3N37_22975 [Enterobacter ludwigii]RTN96684.1 flagellar protein FliT [Enterobacter sp. WCHEn090032]HDR2520014.1 flagellar protein FliT [Enterobacter ludwigii]
MDNSIMELLEQMLISNATLLQQADNGEWTAFIDESEAYAMGMRTLCEVDLTQLGQETKAQVSALLAQLLDQDALLTRAIQARLSTISSELSTLRKSNASAKAYTAV